MSKSIAQALKKGGYSYNLSPPGYTSAIEDFLLGSAKIPPKVFIPKPKGTKPEKYAWEKD